MDTEHYRILWVEDNPYFVRVVRKWFEPFPQFEFVNVDRLSLIAKECAKGRFDLILLDLGLPDGRGPELVTQVSQLSPGTPIVTFTATFPDESTTLEVLERGAQEHLLKENFNAQLLKQTMLRAIHRKEAQKILEKSYEELDLKVKEKTQALAKANELLDKEISERIQSDVMAREREARLQLVMGQVPAILCSTDTELRFNYLTGAGLAALKLDPRQAVGRTLADCFQTKDPEFPLIQYHVRALQGEQVAEEWEWNGRTYNCHLEPLRNAEGRTIGTTGIILDITERKKLDRMKNEFISTISHELKTPLTSIHSSLSLMAAGAAGPVPAKSRELINIAFRNCERMIRLISDILDAQKLDAGIMEFIQKPLELVRLVKQTVEACQPISSQDGIEIVFESRLKEARVLGDSDRLAQVIHNLISNAIKFSPPKSKILVSIFREHLKIRVAVRDFGQGIPDSFKEQIFQKFSHLDVPDRRIAGGTGLGLWLSKVIIQKHRGEISFRSGDQGTTFYFDLPQMKKTESAGAGALEPSSNLKVLICEDEPDVAMLISLMLEDAGFTSEIASNAAQAKQRLAQNQFDAMTLDIFLPDQDGISMVRELRRQEQTRRLPIVIVSAKAQQACHELGGENLGITEWIEKPIDQDLLKKSLQKAVHLPPEPSPFRPQES